MLFWLLSFIYVQSSYKVDYGLLEEKTVFTLMWDVAPFQENSTSYSEMFLAFYKCTLVQPGILIIQTGSCHVVTLR